MENEHKLFWIVVKNAHKKSG